MKWDEFHALLFVLRSPLPESVETKEKRNIIKWDVRRVSFWTDCDELVQEWLNNVQEAVDSEDLPLTLWTVAEAARLSASTMMVPNMCSFNTGCRHSN